MASTAGDVSQVWQTGSAAPVALFICTNCAREGRDARATQRDLRAGLCLDWPFAVDEMVVPCSGKIQPEHLLKAFEAGADLVCVVGCEQDNCHCLEGSRRAAQRVHYVRELLDEAGLGGERLLMFYLPGTAREDMAAAFSVQSGTDPGEASRTRISSLLEGIRDEMIARLASLRPSPLRGDSAARRASSMEAE